MVRVVEPILLVVVGLPSGLASEYANLWTTRQKGEVFCVGSVCRVSRLLKSEVQYFPPTSSLALPARPAGFLPSLNDPTCSNCRLVVLILLVLAVLLVLNVLALLLGRWGHGQWLLNLGANVNPGAASQALNPGYQT